MDYISFNGALQTADLSYATHESYLEKQFSNFGHIAEGMLNFNSQVIKICEKN